MKSFKLCTALLLWVLVCISCKPQEDTAQLQQQSIKVSDTLTAKALEHWRTDSLGCLKLRTWNDATTLVEYFNLRDVQKDSVLKVLGTPNYVVDAPEISTWSYDIYKGCENGLSAESAKGVSVKISRITQKVTDISFTLH